MTKELYEQVMAFKEKTFPNSTPSSELKHLKKEVKELKDAIGKKYSESNQEDAELEVADCFFLLYGIANGIGMDYESVNDAIKRKLVICENRKWGKPDKDGVVEHIKE